MRATAIAFTVCLTAGVTLGVLLSPASASAADAGAIGAGAEPPKPASSGATDVAKEGFASAQAAQAAEEEKKTVNDVAINAGGLFASGNARNVAVTLGSKGRIRRDEHQFSYGLAANYASSAKPGDTSAATTVENVQGLLRYDYYFVDGWSAFFQSSFRHDRFQGLDARFNFDPGVAHYFIDEKTHRLWAEAGYDFQYDVRTREALDAAANPADPVKTPPQILDKTKGTHSVRAFIGYENKLNATVSFVTSLEYLQSVQRAQAARLNFDIGIKAQVVNHLSVATTYSMRFDNDPLPGVLDTDSIAAVNLVYTLF